MLSSDRGVVLQSRCRQLLLSNGHNALAFQLFSEFLHADGLMEAVYQSPRHAPASSDNGAASASAEKKQQARSAVLDAAARPRLFQLLKTHSRRRVAVEDQPLLTSCCEWLEARSMPAEVLAMGLAADRSLLEQFVEVLTQRRIRLQLV